VTQEPRSRRTTLGRYIVVGLGSVCIDAGVYWLLFSLTGESIASKAVSYVAGALFSYLANWRFTFGRRRSNLSEVLFVLIYASSWAINVGLNELVLHLLPVGWLSAIVAYLVATGFTTVWNYVGQSLLVFTRHAQADNLSETHVNERAIDDHT
jgi:putative flippase GtrA